VTKDHDQRAPCVGPAADAQAALDTLERADPQVDVPVAKLLDRHELNPTTAGRTKASECL
jgi:hypothetical protein